MTVPSNLPPLPWSWEDNGQVDRPMGHGFVYLLDAKGRKIGTLWGKPEEKVAAADLIVVAAEVMRELLEALKGVVAIADRKTVEFDRAHAAIAKAEGRS